MISEEARTLKPDVYVVVDTSKDRLLAAQFFSNDIHYMLGRVVQVITNEGRQFAPLYPILVEFLWTDGESKLKLGRRLTLTQLWMDPGCLTLATEEDIALFSIASIGTRYAQSKA